MLRLNLASEPEWLDLGHGVRLLVAVSFAVLAALVWLRRREAQRLGA